MARPLHVVDEFTREALAMEVATSQRTCPWSAELAEAKVLVADWRDDSLLDDRDLLTCCVLERCSDHDDVAPSVLGSDQSCS